MTPLPVNLFHHILLLSSTYYYCTLPPSDIMFASDTGPVWYARGGFLSCRHPLNCFSFLVQGGILLVVWGETGDIFQQEKKRANVEKKTAVFGGGNRNKRGKKRGCVCRCRMHPPNRPALFSICNNQYLLLMTLQFLLLLCSHELLVAPSSIIRRCNHFSRRQLKSFQATLNIICLLHVDCYSTFSFFKRTGKWETKE